MLLSIAFTGCFLVQTPSATPNDFFKRGTPTFVVGTAGDEAAVEKLGVDKVRQHLYGATAPNWGTECKEAGTTSQESEAAFRAVLGGP